MCVCVCVCVCVVLSGDGNVLKNNSKRFPTYEYCLVLEDKYVSITCQSLLEKNFKWGNTQKGMPVEKKKQAFKWSILYVIGRDRDRDTH